MAGGCRKKCKVLLCGDESLVSSNELFGVLALSDVIEQHDDDERIGTPLSRDKGVVVRGQSADDG